MASERDIPAASNVRKAFNASSSSRTEIAFAMPTAYHET